MQARLLEFIMYYDTYLEFVEKQKDLIDDNLSGIDRDEFRKFLSEWDHLDDTAHEMINEIELRYLRLKDFWEQAEIIFKEKQKELHSKLTHSHNGISISRQPLPYSSYAASAGYDKDNQCLDIEYKTGKLYRYMNVPKEVFEKILILKSLRDMKAIIEQFEFERIN